MRSIGNLGVLNDERENRKMLGKLPEWAITKWAGIVDQHRQDKGEFPPFKAFVEFITKQARIATDPVTSFQSIRFEQVGVMKDRPPLNKWIQPHQTFATIDEGRTKDMLVRKVRCNLCPGIHELEACMKFKAMNLADKKQFAWEKRLCFACLQYGHVSRKCRQREKCDICAELHPTSFHRDIRPPKETDSVREENSKNLVDGISGTILMNHSKSSGRTSMILPVYVSHANNPGVERLIYAILDTQSDTSFILQDTCRAMGLVGKPVKLKLSTIHAENGIIDSSKVRGLVVRGFNNQNRIMLPDTYTRNIMPANRAYIPTPEVARLWPHLANSIPPLRDCKVGLLIGHNCIKALTPRDVITPTGDGPYGQRTDLGWGIVGLVKGTWEDADGDDVGTSHHIVVRELANDLSMPGGSGSAIFSLKNKILCSFPRVVLKEVLLIECCMRRNVLA